MSWFGFVFFRVISGGGFAGLVVLGARVGVELGGVAVGVDAQLHLPRRRGPAAQRRAQAGPVVGRRITVPLPQRTPAVDKTR